MTLDFHYSLGFRNSKKSVAFYSEDTVVFAAGKLCALFELDSGLQKHFQFAECGEVSAIVRCGILLAGALSGRPPSVCLFNTLSETKKFYSAPAFMESEVFTCLSVSVNLKFVAAQGGLPDWLLVIWSSQTRQIAMTVNPAGSPGASVHDISFHAGGRDELVVVGSGVFKLYEYQDEAGEDKHVFEEIVFDKFEKSGFYRAISWPEKENLAVGSSKGDVLFFRGIELVNELSLEDDFKRVMQCDIPDSDFRAVTSIVATPQRLLCAFSGSAVLIYEGEEITSYALIKLIVLPSDNLAHTVPGEAKERPDQLLNIIASPTGRDLVATTRDGQMLLCPNFAEQGKHRQFTILLQRQHGDPIIGIDVSRSRPLIASCSRHVVILWNLCARKQELRKIFKEEIRSVAIHPTGLFVALGFDHYCRLFSILHRRFRERNLFACKNCSRLGFSPGGHLLAIVSGSVIEVYSFVTSALLFKLDGHAGLVTSFDWIDHETKFLSCDIRGVVCEWDLVSSKKNWEITATLSYSSVAANPVTGSLIAVGTNKSIRCFDKALLRWTLKCNHDVVCAIFSSDGKSFYVGTSDGCLEFYSYPTSDESVLVHAHSGKVSGIKYDSKKDLLISSGSDGCIFLWETSKWNTDNSNEGILSKLCLVDTSDLAEQKNQSEQLRLSLKHTDTKGVCEFELSCVKNEEVLRTLALDHQQKVDDLNEKMAQIKEEKQTVLFDSAPKLDRKELDVAMRKEITDTTLRLNEAYKKSSAYADETNKIILNYESAIDQLNKKHAKFSCTESNEIEKIVERIKVLENRLLLEKQIGEQAQLTREEYRRKAETEMNEEAGNMKSSQVVLFEREKSKSTELQLEIEKLKHLTEFRVRDTKKRRNITAGQVDYDMTEKNSTITWLKKNYQKLESVLESKEKTCQKQEKKFCYMRKLVGSLKKCHFVSNTAVDELMREIDAKQPEIKSCQDAIKEVTSFIPRLEEEIELTEDLCSTVTQKLRETVDGYQKKEKELRDKQAVASRYVSTLHRCITKECDPLELRDAILFLFEESRAGFVDAAVDANLLDEFNFQIDTLKGCYDHIKGEPSKAMRDKSMADFRLSMENSRILRKVHDLQKECERLGLVIGQMESIFGTQPRNRIEFAVDAASETSGDEKRMESISKLDLLTEEQQREIERFQTMLAAALAK